MKKNISNTDFYKLIKKGFDNGGYANEDIIAIITPLLITVSEIHHRGNVSLLDDINNIIVEDEKLNINNEGKSIRNNIDKINELFPKSNQTFEISEQYNQKIEIGENTISENINSSFHNIEENEEIASPVYLINYMSYEVFFNHHDPLTDVFILGMILASIALNLDFSDTDDLRKFIDRRRSLIYIKSDIHPAIANIIIGMTELDRKKRWKDLSEIIIKLKNYRDYNPENEYDLSEIVKTKTQNRNQFIQEKLRNRLFDNSRRNRLLYYKPNVKFLNLTISSVPQVLNYKNINPNNLFFWNQELSQKVINASTISLNKYLLIDQNPYIVPTLDKIRIEANKDINEYGFSQLKLVLCFLNWYNTKENITEKINTPLLLISVSLIKKKGLKDQYTLEFISNEIEINPVLANELKTHYDIKLPDSIQVSDFKMEDVYQLLKIQIEKNNSGIALDYINKPKIKLIHTQAKQTLSQYNKRAKKREAVSNYKSLPYSYNTEDYQPYGLALYNNYIRPSASNLEFVIDEDIKLDTHQFNQSKNREFYTIDEGNTNPFQWEFDTCNMVLGNFNYKKMSLVRDFNYIIDDNIESSVFDKLFSSISKKEFDQHDVEENNFSNIYNVVASDPTQNKAVKVSETGQSYIIQGPPGTGKSQTIANLVANFVAQNKKVLFVCEKRAALDVVYYRLKNQGLDELCCLIHDSQSDKKEFIQNLKNTYNNFTTTKDNLQNNINVRQNILKEINSEILFLNEFHQFMNKEFKGTFIYKLFEVLISNDNILFNNTNYKFDTNTTYKDYIECEGIFQKLEQYNNESNGSLYFSEHPFKYFKTDDFANLNSIDNLKKNIDELLLNIDELNERIDINETQVQSINSIGSIFAFFNECSLLIPFKENNAMQLLIDKSENANLLEIEIAEIQEINKQLEKVKSIYPNWNSIISEIDAKNAFDIMLQYEGKFFNFLFSAYRNTKAQINKLYDINKHQIKPEYKAILSNKIEEYQLINSRDEKQTSYEKKYYLGNLFLLKESIILINKKVSKQNLDYMLSINNNQLEEIKYIINLSKKIEEKLKEYFEDITHFSLKELEQKLEQIKNKQQYFSLYSTLYKELLIVDKSIIAYLKNHPIKKEQLAYLLAHKTLEDYYIFNHEHEKYNLDIIHHAIQKIKKRHEDLFIANGNYIVSKQKNNLKQLITISEMSVAGKSEKEKQDKKSISEGRKILENEFTKSIRFKSIRDLAANEAGQIIRELKPVWLMSPLSVSDALPLDENYFDVVIFDEASQITLEEGLPPIYRAKQTIIVGDEMQMPPSNFFGSSSYSQDDLWQDNENENDFFTLDADSFLTQGARKFPSIMLGWHYRSKHEVLIGFSNASFYENKLYTIPDVKDHEDNATEIIVDSIEEASNNIEYIYNKPISYHYIKNGVYNARTNEKEASYIANLVKELLTNNKGYSIGIVAFSMEQQSEIESALEDICIADKNFEALLEEEYKKEENNQFVGLFIKNLENVQGDERDIIIMSTCYGYDPNGRMLMNFGPINKRGGEKRLNVIFSRAKKSMCVVSSIKYFDIKNEYNEGANYFRKYLQYAELISLGNIKTANEVLYSINNENKKEHVPQVAQQIKAALEANGFYVQCNIGQSKFKCHLAIKNKSSDKEYILGINIDDDVFYSNKDITEQYILKPDILRMNGWKICHVYIKDWFDNKSRVLAMINSQIKDEDFFSSLSIDSLVDKATELKEVIHTETISNSINDDKLFDRYICTSNASNKFWEICIDDKNIVIQYGKIGTKGQRLIKTYSSNEQADNESKKLITQKLAKDYFKEE